MAAGSQNVGWNCGFQPSPGVAPRIVSSHGLGRGCSFESCSKNSAEFRELLREWPLIQAPKKGINIKNFNRNPPARPSPPKGAPDPCKFFMFGASFPWKHRKKPEHKEFRRGEVLGGPKFFMLKFCVCSVCSLLMEGTCWAPLCQVAWWWLHDQCCWCHRRQVQMCWHTWLLMMM